MKYNPRDENSIKAVMAKANVVINLIGMQSVPIILLISNTVRLKYLVNYCLPCWQEENMRLEIIALRK